MDLPVSFVNRMKEYLGEEFDAFIKSYDAPEVKGLRMKNKEMAPGSILGAVFDADGCLEAGIESSPAFTPVPWC